jgi:hypothetical protein
MMAIVKRDDRWRAWCAARAILAWSKTFGSRADATATFLLRGEETISVLAAPTAAPHQ